MLEGIRNTYLNKKVFLTGHTGFKGAWMTLILHLFGAEIKGYALEPEEQIALYNLVNGDSLCSSTISDIRDKEKLMAEVTSFNPDFIFHFAAQSLVRRSYELPVDTFEVNVIGTVNLLEAVRNLPGPCIVIIVTTDKVYENMEWERAYKEEDKLGGYDPYSSSKACAEIASASYRSAFFHPMDYDKHQKSLSTARAGNVIGGGDWAKDRIVPDLARAFLAGKTLSVRNPNAIRPWQHVLEPLGGYLQLGRSMVKDPVACGDCYNFGPVNDDELKVEELVKIAIEQWGSGEYEAANLENEPHEANILKLDIEKATHTLGWKPSLDSREAIARTIFWYKNYEKDPYEITRKQITDYFGLE